ncbi:MAG: GNAT family N-acetyltransferase [Clostridia bacterium]|nr:GNAT family N-acetyltransferase [Clostridia bacterium]
MDLLKFDGKHVRVTDKWGDILIGVAEYESRDFLECEYGGEEDGIFIEDCLIYHSQIESIEEIEVHGTIELWTERLILRRYRLEDADALYHYLGTDPEMVRYSGWNPYATPEMARETVSRFIASYDDEHSYSWIMDIDGVIVGTIGAYDYRDDGIEVGLSVVKAWQGRGLATEAMKKVLQYLTENEHISCVTAWCASENFGSRRVLEKAGMNLVLIEKDDLVVGGKVYDKLNYEYRRMDDESIVG